ncbi:MAG TPA: Qat anti-phage system QueC-like protein QatC [Candidatus Sulfotelmatobacter sp.]|nr:Qat anti-phage system QueC-like protein QatC [Candidatus Sulfotelmatobacter sp.]
MKLVCAPKNYGFPDPKEILGVVLYDSANSDHRGSVGAAVKEQILKDKLAPAARAWDLLSLALSVTGADLAGHRSQSPDGWTREFDLEVATIDPNFWNGQVELINRLLSFLTTDRWRLHFVEGGLQPAQDRYVVRPNEDQVILLSGGLDSLVGYIDLISSGSRPLAVSQIVKGDAENQRHFAQEIGTGLRHFQINHNAYVPDPENPPSQRARSFLFVAYGVLIATTLERYHGGHEVTLYVCQNGFISINPPLTGSRLGSLSTRTTHPEFLAFIEELLDSAGLHVRIENPYQVQTKGEILLGCKNQRLIRTHAVPSVSCGRFKRYGYTHCGRCVPCLVRRAAFRKWGVKDDTQYVYEDLGRDDKDHAGFDDVRSVAMAILEVRSRGIQDWIGTSLNTATLGDVAALEAMVRRGLSELESLMNVYGVK